MGGISEIELLTYQIGRDTRQPMAYGVESMADIPRSISAATILFFDSFIIGKWGRFGLSIVVMGPVFFSFSMIVASEKIGSIFLSL